MSLSKRISCNACSCSPWPDRSSSGPSAGSRYRHWRIHESRVALTLQVERHEGLDNDLVAALQFADAAPAMSGSRDLQRAVVDRAARLAGGSELRPGPAVTVAPTVFRGLLVSVLVVAAISLIWPDHVRVFARRLCLASPHYPTRSTIERIAIDGTVVLERSERGTQPDSITRPEGSPVFFRVWVGGRLPDVARVQLTTRDGRRREIPLSRQTAEGSIAAGDVPRDSDPAQPNDDPGYQGHLPRLLEPARFQVFLGDAWSDPAELRMVPLPTIELNLRPVLPEYARRVTRPAAGPDRQQVAVLEGSGVRVSLRCSNGKRLRSAWLTIVSRDPPQRFELTPDGSPEPSWELQDADSPFARIDSDLRFQVQVIDQDGLSLESPLPGLIRLQPDLSPTCSASLVHRVVLPTASPVIEYRATDDYGLARMWLEGQLERTAASESGALPTFSLPILDESGPWLADQLPRSGRYPLELADLAATFSPPLASPAWIKGDRLKLTLVVQDFRGASPGETTRSESMLLEISDQSGVLTAISEADEQSEQRLDDLIKQQLGIGTD